MLCPETLSYVRCRPATSLQICSTLPMTRRTSRPASRSARAGPGMTLTDRSKVRMANIQTDSVTHRLALFCMEHWQAGPTKFSGRTYTKSTCMLTCMPGSGTLRPALDVRSMGVTTSSRTLPRMESHTLTVPCLMREHRSSSPNSLQKLG